MTPLIDETIRGLSCKNFKLDPIMGSHLSRQNSVLGSAQKRHGFILEKTILETLKTYSQFTVWEDPRFQVNEVADHLVSSSLDNPEKLLGTNTFYPTNGYRSLQVDLLVYENEAKTLRSYEIKRGNGLHDAGKRRSILRDLLCTQVLLKAYGEAKGFEIHKAQSHIIFYYGDCSIKKPFSITGNELDVHFGVPVRDIVEAVNDEFRKKLISILEGH